MKIILSNVIDITEPTEEIMQYCKKSLTFANPEYSKRAKMGFYVGKIPKVIKLYNYYDGHLYMPIGVFNDIYALHPYLSDYFDYSVERNVNVKNHIVLRDYQEPVIKTVKEKINGLIIAPCGTGKTSMLLSCFAELKQKTLWICNTMELLMQAKNRCEESIDCRTSVITEGKCDASGDIVFSTVQTLVKIVENECITQDLFGMLIVDEVHLVSAKPDSLQMFRKCIEYFSAKYRLGTTATLYRADGLHNCIVKIMGEVIYSIEQKDDMYYCMYDNEVVCKFPVDRFQVPAYVKVRETGYSIRGNDDVFNVDGGTLRFTELISKLSMDEKRNEFILNDLRNVSGSTLVLSNRVEQLKYLAERLDSSVEIDGSTPKKIRIKAIEDVKNGKIKYLLASYNLARQGLDIHILSNLCLATPVKDFAVVVQSVGRIQRPYPGKDKAVVYDYVDDVGMLLGFYTKRRAIYRNHKWKIENEALGGGR